MINVGLTAIGISLLVTIWYRGEDLNLHEFPH